MAKVAFERLADLASFGQGVIEVDVCGMCAAVVLRKQQDRHRRWHGLLEIGGQYPEPPPEASR